MVARGKKRQGAGLFLCDQLFLKHTHL